MAITAGISSGNYLGRQCDHVGNSMNVLARTRFCPASAPRFSDKCLRRTGLRSRDPLIKRADRVSEQPIINCDEFCIKNPLSIVRGITVALSVGVLSSIKAWFDALFKIICSDGLMGVVAANPRRSRTPPRVSDNAFSSWFIQPPRVERQTCSHELSHTGNGNF